MSVVKVDDYRHPGGWTIASSGARAENYCRELERGNILFFKDVPFALPEEDVHFLLSREQSESVFHKNVSYRPTRDLLRGASGSPSEIRRLQEIMSRYSKRVTQFVCEFLSPYSNAFDLDYASFRPLEEEDRSLPLHKRNDLLHVDAFPSRPTAGKRILRVFTNIHPEKVRKWNTGEPFHILAPQLASSAALIQITARKSRPAHRALRKLLHALQALRLPVIDRSPYDAFMLHFHDYLKENSGYQRDSKKFEFSFPPRSTWMVFTDTVPHAVLSGQSALEQTFIVSLDAMVAQDQAPIRVLEKLAGVPLAP